MLPQNKPHKKSELFCKVTHWIKRFASRDPSEWGTTILKQFDESAKKGLFPYLSTDEHSAFAKARLTAFRSSKEWLVVFEILSYIGEVGEVTNILYSYGNRVKPSLEWVGGLGFPRKVEVNSDYWVPDPFDFEFIIYGEHIRFAPLPSEYDMAGVDLNQAISGDQFFDRHVQILRFLAHTLTPDKLFLDEQHILERLYRSEDLAVFIRIYGWDHPDPTMGCIPSDSLCLQSLARALANNRPEMYRCPREVVNTHWSEWRNYFAVF